jgi:hypothetical protein
MASSILPENIRSILELIYTGNTSIEMRQVKGIIELAKIFQLHIVLPVNATDNGPTTAASVHQPDNNNNSEPETKADESNQQNFTTINIEAFMAPLTENNLVSTPIQRPAKQDRRKSIALKIQKYSLRTRSRRVTFKTPVKEKNCEYNCCPFAQCNKKYKLSQNLQKHITLKHPVV